VHAIILAGGKGERLRPLTDSRPKGMVEVAGRPILAHQLDWLRHHGITHVTISCGYLANVIQDYFRKGAEFGIAIQYALEEQPLGRGGGLRYAMSGFETRDPIVGMNGDNITNLDLGAMISQHREKTATATVALAALQSPYGLAELEDDGFISGFQEKPRLPYWLNAGIYVFDPSIRELLPERGDHEDTTFPDLAARHKLLGYRISGYWRTADTAKDVSELSRDLEQYEPKDFLRGTS
jgi:NDP-sugar pyrophosphorylase family protein